MCVPVTKINKTGISAAGLRCWKLPFIDGHVDFNPQCCRSKCQSNVWTQKATSQLSTGVTNAGDATAAAQSPGTGEPGPGSGGVAVGGATSGGLQAENGIAGEAKGDRWEFPRYRLKFFNILGEGAFGQVWRCEATNINGKCVRVKCMNLSNFIVT